ncbi:UDP-glucose:glycoprotein glucosyltransferase 1 [Dirofilaria immitis]|nr:UDP-glucose:glycoprotein glucosyltransferase 1 [Dirofilaria immitis]
MSFMLQGIKGYFNLPYKKNIAVHKQNSLEVIDQWTALKSRQLRNLLDVHVDVNPYLFSVEKGMESLWLIIILSALPSLTDSAVKKKSVITSLHAKWSQTSFIAEASEFMAQESDSLFWIYIDEIVEKLSIDEWHTCIQQIYISDSDARQYDLAIRLAGYLLQEARVNLLKFALSLRAHSPTVVLFQRLGAERKKSCNAFADVHGTIICDVNDLEKVIESGVKGPAPTVYSIDHVFPATKEHNVTLIVYGELATLSWRKFHLAAKTLSRSGKDARDDKLLLSGYGVELAIKNTEYKAVDDSTVIDKITVEEKSEDYTDNEDDNCGFNFNTLRRLHNDLKDSIEQFRLHLLERDELTPLKVWQVQELSYQAAQTIVQAGSQKALNTMIDSSQNFPLAARSLSRQIVRKEFVSEVSANQSN